MRQLLLPGLLALLVLLAGCSMLDDPGNETAPTNTSPDTGPFDQHPNQTDLSLDDAQAHEQALRTAGSFTAHTSYERSDRAAIEQTYRIDLTTTHYAKTFHAENRQYDYFTNETATYERATAPDGATKHEFVTHPLSDDAPFAPVTVDAAVADPAHTAHLLVNADRISYVKTAETDGDDGYVLTTYEVNETRIDNPTETLTAHTPLISDHVTVDTVSATLVIDDRGIIRSHEWTATVVEDPETEYTVTYTYETDAIGSTTVTEPDWLTEATPVSD